VNIQNPCREGRNGVDVKGFDAFLGSRALESGDAGLIIVEAIDKMECYSERFKKLVREILDSDKPVIATIALKVSAFINDVRKWGAVCIIKLNQVNRDLLVDGVVKQIKALVQLKNSFLPSLRTGGEAISFLAQDKLLISRFIMISKT
jgi:nucleoside-triphosphatase